MEELDKIVAQISTGLDEEKFVDAATQAETENGISLLALKNESLLAYIGDLLLLAAAQTDHNTQVFDQARDGAIEQRVTLEKGVKGLEAKISYQIDKALRTYRRSLEQEQEQDEDNKDNDDKQSEAEDSDSDVDVTSFRPNLAALKSGRAGKPSRSQRTYDDDDQEEGEYVAPKISANMPAFERSKGARAPPKKRDFAMEEYIRESGDAPVAEPSIGSQIMDSGRGDERTERDRKKDREVQTYEEANFTRISNTSSKRARKEASQRQRDATTNTFFGEDWGFLDGDNKRRKRRH